MKNNNIMTNHYRPLRLFSLETIAALGVAVCIAMLPAASQAQQWRFEPIVKVGGEYDDNATLTPVAGLETEISGLLASLEADIEYSSQVTSFVVQPRFLTRNYSVDSASVVDEDQFDSDDFFLTSQLRHEGQKTTSGFRAAYDQQNVRTAERAIADSGVDDPGDIIDDSTGLTIPVGTRDKLRFAPFLDYQLSEISTIGASLDYVDVAYDDVIGDFLADYSDARINLNYRRRLFNLTTALVTATGRNFESDRALDDITGYGLLVGFERNLSATTTLSAMIGAEDTEQAGLSLDPEVVGYVTLTRNLETIRMFAQYRRSVSATGAGSVESRDAVNLNFQKRFTEKITAGFGIRAYDSTRIGGAAATTERSYVQLQTNFGWNFTRSLSLEAEYRYSLNDRGAALGGEANSNQVNLWFVYQPGTRPEI